MDTYSVNSETDVIKLFADVVYETAPEGLVAI